MAEENPIVVVGAGPGGLVLAHLLALNGIQVRVFERHKDFDRQFRGEFLQPSAMPILAALGILEELDKVGSVMPVSAVRMHFRGRVVSTTEDRPGVPAGFLVHQPTLLGLIYRRCCELKDFRLDMQSEVTGFSRTDGRIDGVQVRSSGREERVQSRLVIVSNGRISALRSPLGLTANNLEPPYTILWLRFDMSRHRELMPKSLDGFVGKRALCVMFPTHGTRLQIMWRRRPKYSLDWSLPPAVLGQALLEDLPPRWRQIVAGLLEEQTERQVLRVVSDRLSRWWSPGALCIGDAAHSMSPIGGQGLAMAIRDAVVASNHIIRAHHSGQPFGNAMCSAIQDEREPEIENVQRFQARAAKLHVATPIIQWAMAKVLIPSVTKMRGKSYMDDLQNGFVPVRPEYIGSER
jgi:2-polyprenyl-6-methoxyphenol hydroxylase-like FAD-dependent oxidoreductase